MSESENLNRQMAEALVSFMEDTGITRADVARHLGNRSASYVGERLSGKRPLALDIAGAVCELAHLTPASLMVELSDRMLRAQRG